MRRIRTRAYRAFRFKGGQGWWVGNGVGYRGQLVLTIGRRCFWRNFEALRWIVSRALRRRVRKRYRFKRQKSAPRRFYYKWPLRREARLLWVGGMVWLPLAAKPRGSRMGRGKGGFRVWYAHMRAGTSIVRLRYHKSVVVYVMIRRLLANVSACRRGNMAMVVRDVQYRWYW